MPKPPAVRPLIVVNFAFNGDVANVFCSAPADVLLLYEEGMRDEHRHMEATLLIEGVGHSELLDVLEWDEARKKLPVAQRRRYPSSEEQD